ncbi:MAG TPA: preprotein translocase subunit SecA [Thermotogaceae bacterium]|nr:preprotein translocase subunit SecA [Thermotogaceae bacterium]
MGILGKIFDKNKRYIKKYKKIVQIINSFEERFSKLTNEELASKSAEFKQRLKNGETLDDILPEAFAVVREVSKRTIGMRHFDVQLIGGMVLHEGNVAEMKTGEGKTLVATLSIYLNALTGEGVHLVTVNDYLARRDALWMGPIYLFLGLKVGVINSLNTSYEVVWENEELFEKAIKENKSIWPKDKLTDLISDEERDLEALEMFKVKLVPISRREAYLADVTYGTNNEFGFDYLRDNLVYDLKDRVQRGHNYAIVDEVDSILIDEARTPLIISGPSKDSSKLYKQFAAYARRMVKDKDFVMDEKEKTISLTDEGITKVEKLLGIDNLYDPSNIDYLYHMLNALKALHFFKRDVDYIVTPEGEVVIVDEFTGRLLPGRRYSEGLHQAIEAKEGVKIREESITYATITFQNYFRMYKKLAGMTGTAKTEEEEFQQIYSMDVVVVPTNKPVIRIDHNDVIYRTQKEKFEAVVEDIEERYKKGQPILVGTTSIEKSELLSAMLRKKEIPHEVLNAKYHEKEAMIIAKAGQRGAVTIATNMAGRGTDIKLGPGVKELGGLYVIGTERHESRRIDNQLRGRSGRQGDPGETRFYLSLEDDLLRLFGGEKIKGLMDTLKIDRGQPIEHNILTHLIENAQKKVEGIHFAIRKRLLELDSVLDKQRNAIYEHRNWVLSEDNIEEHIREIYEDIVDRRLETYCPESKEWDFEGLKTSFGMFPPSVISSLDGKREFKNAKELREYLLKLLWDAYKAKKEEIGEEDFLKVVKLLILRVIDERWRKHLEQVEHVKNSVGLRAYGNKDPVIEFKRETYDLFQEMIDNIYDDIGAIILRLVRFDREKAEEKAKSELSSLNMVHEEFQTFNRREKRKLERRKNTSSKRFKVKR